MQFGIGIGHHFGDDGDELIEKRFPSPDSVPIQDGSAQQPTHDIFFSLRTGIDVFVDGKRAGTHMIGDAPQSPAFFASGIIFDAQDVGGGQDDRLEDVDMEVRVDTLQHGGRSLQSHPRIDVLAGQGAEVVGRRPHAIVLREDQVPDFDGLARVCMVENLAAWAADTVWPLARRIGRPEVFILSQSLDAGFGKPDLFVPDLVGFVVVEVDRDGKAVGVEPEPFFRRAKLPRPVDGLAFEIITEAEVPEHLEERVVVCRPPDVFDVTGAQALLARGGSSKLQFHLPKEMVLELVHPGWGEQHRRIPGGNQNVAGAPPVPLRLEEGQIFLA